MSLQPKIEKKVVGKTVIATLDGKKCTLTLDAEPKKVLIELIDKYNKRPSKTAFEKIFKQFHAKEVEAKQLALVNKKVQKRTLKDAEQELKVSKEEIKQLSASVEDMKKINADTQAKLDELIAKSEAAASKIKESTVTHSAPRRGEY